jgi:hypothetical protein
MSDEAQHEDYEWDVAVSLCDVDLPLARQLYDGLKDRFKVFLYSEEEKTLQFRNGVKVLSDIYRHKARAVVVIWRPEWGKSKWTGLEEECLTDRVLNETPAFILLVKIETGETPAWIPSTYIYRSHQVWGLDTLVETVAGRVNQLGGEIRCQTPLEIARLQKSERDWKLARHSTLTSQAAADARAVEVAKLKNAIKSHIDSIASSIDGRPMEFEEIPRAFAVIKHPCCAVIRECDEFDDDSPYQMCIQEWDGIIGLYGNRANSIPPDKHHQDDFAMDVHKDGDWFWRNLKTQDAFTTEKLAETVVNRLLVRTHKLATGEIKRRQNRTDNPRIADASSVLGTYDEY